MSLLTRPSLITRNGVPVQSTDPGVTPLPNPPVSADLDIPAGKTIRSIVVYKTTADPFFADLAGQATYIFSGTGVHTVYPDLFTGNSTLTIEFKVISGAFGSPYIVVNYTD